MRLPATAFALALATMPAMAQVTGLAEGAPVAVIGVEAGSTLNLRQGPGTSHPVLGTLGAGESGLTVEYCDATGRWCRVRSADGRDGWVAATYLGPNAASPPQPPETHPAWHTYFPPDAVYAVAGITAGSALNVRGGPGTDAPIVASLPLGRGRLTIRTCTDAVDWCQVETNGSVLGWVAAPYLGDAAAMAETSARPDTTPRFNEANRLTRTTGIALDPGGTTSVPELPPYLLGDWDTDRTACTRTDSENRVTILKNGLTVGAATARFKTALFRSGGYDLTTLLMQEEDVLNAVPQRALYRLEPDSENALTLSGDVLAEQRLAKCGG